MNRSGDSRALLMDRQPSPPGYAKRSVSQIKVMNEVRFRSASKEDQEFLWHALFLAVSVPPDTPQPKPEVIKLPELAKYAENWMSRPGDLGFIATVNGRQIGVAWIREWSDSDHGYGYVNSTIPELSISFLPEYRAKGFGTILLVLSKI